MEKHVNFGYNKGKSIYIPNGFDTKYHLRREITNNAGGNYSEYAYDVQGATRNNIVYPSYDPMIFEVKYPSTDIQGRVVSL